MYNDYIWLVLNSSRSQYYEGRWAVIKIPRSGDRISKGPRKIYFWKF